MIKDFMNNAWSCKCIGCSIGIGEINPPGGIITETKNFVLHQDPEESSELFDLVYRSRLAMKNIVNINSDNKTFKFALHEKTAKHTCEAKCGRTKPLARQQSETLYATLLIVSN